MISYVDLKDEATALYLNFPFCKLPCTYCHYIENIDFGYSSIPDEYVLMVTTQLNHVLSCLKGKRLKSIYWGGGTPSLLTDNQIKKISDIFEKYHVTSKEVSIEIHPGMCNFDYANNYFFTRYSLGVQSFDQTTMTSYCRKGYTIESVTNIIQQIRKNSSPQIINIDLIFDSTLQEVDFDCIRINNC